MAAVGEKPMAIDTRGASRVLLAQEKRGSAARALLWFGHGHLSLG
jgi:hypothetical protein